MPAARLAEVLRRTMTIDSPRQQALQRARDILDELRAMLPDHASAIDALAAKLEAAASRSANV